MIFNINQHFEGGISQNDTY